jgi:WD40 repeat protein
MFDSSKIRECRGHKEKVHTVAWNSDGRKLASGSVDKTARVWSPHRGVSGTNSCADMSITKFLFSFSVDGY